MTRKLAAIALVFVGVWTGTDIARTCGDKFLILGAGPAAPRLYASVHPSSILVVRRSAGLAVDSPLLVSSLKRAGHSVKVIDSQVALPAALAKTKFDVILADLADARVIAAQAHPSSGQPALVPVLSEPTAAQLAAASQEFASLLRAPDKAVNFLKAIDDLLAERLAANPASRAPRKN